MTGETKNKADFDEIVNLVMSNAGYASMRPVIEKEILHYDIFEALDREKLLSNLVFQGGTSLRLCYGSKRFSEDLDFSGGRDFKTANMVKIKECIEDYIGKKYGLLVLVKEPKELLNENIINGIRVDKWQVSVETCPGKSQAPRQKIKIEIANIPSYTQEVRPLLANYAFLSDSAPIFVITESLNEIMADKVLAFPASVKNIRHRDIWDLVWLMQKGATLDEEMVVKKTIDYQTNEYPALLSSSIDRLPEIINSKQFHDQMTRFIDSESINETINNPRFLTYMNNEAGNIFRRMQAYLNASNNQKKDEEFEFRL